MDVVVAFKLTLLPEQIIVGFALAVIEGILFKATVIVETVVQIPSVAVTL